MPGQGEAARKISLILVASCRLHDLAMNWKSDPWLCVCDIEPSLPGYNMALDEVLAETICQPVLRIYSWAVPSVTFGYFEHYQSVRTRWPGVTLMRRWTGGGQVDHRADFTYTVILPAMHRSGLPTAKESYCWVHERVARALQQLGVSATLASAETFAPDGPCFVKPVEADVMVGPMKVAGAAQRRTRTALLHQGSIQGLTIPSNLRRTLIEQFTVSEIVAPSASHRRAAARLAIEKYDTPSWLERR